MNLVESNGRLNGPEDLRDQYFKSKHDTRIFQPSDRKWIEQGDHLMEIMGQQKKKDKGKSISVVVE